MPIPIVDSLFYSGDIRDQSKVVQNCTEFFIHFLPQTSEEGPSNFGI